MAYTNLFGGRRYFITGYRRPHGGVKKTKEAIADIEKGRLYDDARTHTHNGETELIAVRPPPPPPTLRSIIGSEREPHIINSRRRRALQQQPPPPRLNHHESGGGGVTLKCRFYV